jgi:undecaprenyl-diphosphatase
MRPLDAVWIGVAQIFALIPGVSRSGATITAGLADRFDRESAAVFSFLMSMPIILAAALFKVPHVIHDQGLSAPLIAGVLASALSGWLAISALLRYVSRRSYGIFALYRVVVGLGVLLIVHYRG